MEKNWQKMKKNCKKLAKNEEKWGISLLFLKEL